MYESFMDGMIIQVDKIQEYIRVINEFVSKNNLEFEIEKIKWDFHPTYFENLRKLDSIYPKAKAYMMKKGKITIFKSKIYYHLGMLIEESSQNKNE